MPRYSYRAIDINGNTIDGELSATDQAALETQVTQSGNMLLESKELGAGLSFSFSFGPGVSNREKIDFFIQMRGLLNAGVTLLECLRSIRDGVDNEKFRKILSDITDNVEAGNMFYESCSNYPELFEKQLIAMIRAGEESGNLPETFAEIVRYMEWLEGLKKDIQQATMYPISVLIIMTLFISILFTFVVPKFVDLLVSLGVEMPLPTRIVMGLSSFFQNYGLLVLVLVPVIPLSIKAAKKKWDAFDYKWDEMKVKLPVFGKLNLMFTVSRFSHNFSAIFKAGIPVLQNLDLCSELVGNRVMEKALREARDDIEGGMTLVESLKKHHIFNAMELLMISVGEVSGDLGASLDSISEYYNEIIPRTVKKVFGIMEPIMMLSLIGIVGLTAVAIFMPILKLMSSVG